MYHKWCEAQLRLYFNFVVDRKYGNTLLRFVLNRKFYFFCKVFQLLFNKKSILLKSRFFWHVLVIFRLLKF